MARIFLAVRILLVLTVSLWLIMPQGVFAAKAQVANSRFSKGILWKIDGKHKSPSYLLGTMHSEDPRIVNLPPVVSKTLEQCDSLSLEIVPDLMTIALSVRKIVFSDGRSLDKVVDKKTYRRAIKGLSGYGIPEVTASIMKPWAVMVTLSLPKPKTGSFMDMTLYKMALRQDKKIYGLETVDEQIQVFETLSMDKQVFLLKEALDNLPRLPAIIEEMTVAYLQRDLGKLVAISLKYAPKDKKISDLLMKKLLDKRNLNMFRRMQPQMRAGNACIAVGALHLPGKQGLLQMLDRAGYRLTPVY